MSNEKRCELIKARLQQAFEPSYLAVLDESHLHVGHPGAQSGRGHFAISIASKSLNPKEKIDSHRKIYAALSDLMETDIHALRISMR